MNACPPHAKGRGFAPLPGHTKDHYNNGTNCRPVSQCSQTIKALSDDTIFACDCSRLHLTGLQSRRVRGTIVSCETNLR